MPYDEHEEVSKLTRELLKAIHLLKPTFPSAVPYD